MCLAQVMPVRLEPAALWSRVKHSTTEPLRSLFILEPAALWSRVKHSTTEPLRSLFILCVLKKQKLWWDCTAHMCRPIRAFIACQGGKYHNRVCWPIFCLFCYFTSQVNSYGHGGTVSSPNHTFSWASLNKQLTRVVLDSYCSLCSEYSQKMMWIKWDRTFRRTL